MIVIFYYLWLRTILRQTQEDIMGCWFSVLQDRRYHGRGTSSYVIWMYGGFMGRCQYSKL